MDQPALSTPPQENSRTIFRIAAAITGFLLAFLVGYKASVTSFTHDESFTYTRYVHQSFMEIVSYADPFPNNHILNTLLVKWCELCFGSGELSLRLPSIGAMILYMVFAARIVKRLPGVLCLPAFILLLANPYLLDFFGLARGYALSIGFMTMSLFYGISSLKQSRTSSLIFCNLGAMLAVCSNFSMINFYLAMLFTWYGIQWLRSLYNPAGLSRKRAMQHLGINLLFLALTTGIAWEPLRKVTGLHLLDFGGKVGIIHDTVSSLVAACLYHVAAAPFVIALLSWTAAALMLAICVYCLRGLWKDRAGFLEEHLELMVMNAVLLLILLASVTQHILLKQDYFMARFALFLYPLFILNLAFITGSLLGKGHRVKGLPLLFGSMAGLFVLHTAWSWTGRSYLDWEYDRNTRKVMSIVAAHHRQYGAGSDSATIGNTWWYEPSINFYRQTLHLDWLKPADRNGLDSTDSYYYITPQDRDFLPPVRRKGQYQILFVPKERDAWLIGNGH